MRSRMRTSSGSGGPGKARANCTEAAVMQGLFWTRRRSASHEVHRREKRWTLEEGKVKATQGAAGDSLELWAARAVLTACSLRITISTRRFWARPCGVRLLATG